MEASEADFRRLIDQMAENSGAITRLITKLQTTRNQSPIDNSKEKIRRSFNISDKLNSTTNKLSEHFKTLSGSAEELIDGFHHLIRDFIGGAIVAQVVNSGMQLNKTYKSMTEIGQTFGGSMLEMSRQAGAAGLPLEQFAHMLEKNSASAAMLANTDSSLGKLQLAVRENTKEFGYYGMTLEQIGDLTGDYVETLRLQNRSQGINRVTTSKDIAEFAGDISEFANLTGKSRKAIAETTNKAMQDVAFAATDLTDVQEKAARRAIAFMASMPGSAGELLAPMLSQTVAYGSGLFTDQMNTFAEAGASDFIGIIETLGNTVKRGSFTDKDANNWLAQVNNYYKSNRDSLKLQSQAGNQSAKQVLGMFEQLIGMTGRQLAQMKRMGPVTEFFSELESDLSELSGAFREGIMTVIEPLEKTFVKDGNFEALRLKFKEAGEAVGKFIKTLLSPENVKFFKDVFHEIVIEASRFLGFLQRNLIPILRDHVVPAFEWVGRQIVAFKDYFSGLSNTGKTLVEIGAGLILFHKRIFDFIGGAGSLVRGLRSLFGAGEVRINTAVANINAGVIRGAGMGAGVPGGNPGSGGAAALAEEEAGAINGGGGWRGRAARGVLRAARGLGRFALGAVGIAAGAYGGEALGQYAGQQVGGDTGGMIGGTLGSIGGMALGAYLPTLIGTVFPIAITAMMPLLPLILGGLAAAGIATAIWELVKTDNSPEALAKKSINNPSAPNYKSPMQKLAQAQVDAKANPPAIDENGFVIPNQPPATPIPFPTPNSIPNVEPATVTDDNNPFKDLSDDQLKAKQKEITDRVASNNAVQAFYPELVKQARAQTALLTTNNDLMTQQGQIDQVMKKKHLDALNGINTKITQGQIQANQ